MWWNLMKVSLQYVSMWWSLMKVSLQYVSRWWSLMKVSLQYVSMWWSLMKVSLQYVSMWWSLMKVSLQYVSMWWSLMKDWFVFKITTFKGTWHHVLWRDKKSVESVVILQFLLRYSPGDTGGNTQHRVVANNPTEVLDGCHLVTLNSL